MSLALVHQASRWDGRLSEEVTDLRWAPLTQVMELLSSWWVKGPLFVLLALGVDLALRRRCPQTRVPWAALTTLTALLLGSFVSTLLKPVFERARPPFGGAGISAIGDLPTSASFPSGHATTAFAAATALALADRRLRWPAGLLAAGVALSRVYLGMHYVGDVVAGALLGIALALGVAWAADRLGGAPEVQGPSPGAPQLPAV